MKKSIMLRITALAIAASLTPTHAGKQVKKIVESSGALRASLHEINNDLKRDNNTLLKKIQAYEPDAKLLDENPTTNQTNELNIIRDGAIVVKSQIQNETEDLKAKYEALQVNRALHNAIDASAKLEEENKELYEKNKELKEKYKELEEKDKELIEKDMELKKQSEQIETLEKIKDDLEKERSKAKSSSSSYSWF